MRIPFRQGIVSVPPGFLQPSGSSVNLVIPTPAYASVTMADGEANYLHNERITVLNAWTGPFATSLLSFYLYWDINVITGVRTFGHTTLEPIEAASAPPAPQNDQHWFDTVSNKMKVWNSTAGRWISHIRVFAAKLTNGSVITSISIRSPAFEGTQIGALENVAGAAGALIFDINGNPVKRNGGVFFTTEDVAIAGISSAAQVKLGSIMIEAVAISNIPAYTIVHFADFNQVQLATDILMPNGAYGMVEINAVTGAIVNVVMEGLITNPLWNWTTAGVNAPLYVSSTGYLTTVPPPNPIVVATVVDVSTILLRSALTTISIATSGGGGGGPTIGPATTTVLGTVRLSTASGTSTSPVVVETTDPRLSDKVLKAGDTMTGPLVLPADPTLPSQAATKRYVDINRPPLYDQITATAGQLVVNTIVPTAPKTATRSTLQVFRNGILQLEGSTKAYTVTGANQLTFTVGLTLADEITIFAFV
jgi:hypothetical protein